MTLECLNRLDWLSLYEVDIKYENSIIVHVRFISPVSQTYLIPRYCASFSTQSWALLSL